MPPRSASPSCRRLARSFFNRPASVVAPELLNKLVLSLPADGGRALVGRVVEVEAYEPHEPASHTFRGRTARNAVMFGPPGHLYVYFSYGVHWCANVVCGPEGHGAAVLLRALRPLCGADTMAANRPKARTARDLCSGPGKLTAALGIGPGHNGADLIHGTGLVERADLVDPAGVVERAEPLDGTAQRPTVAPSENLATIWLGDDGTPPPAGPDVVVGPRVGITKAVGLPWRWYVRGDPNVSRPR